MFNLLALNRKENQPITVPKKNAGGSISFLPTIGRFAKVCYFYVGKKEYSISATNKYCGGQKILCFKTALLLAPKRWVQGDKKQNLRNYEN